MLVRSLTVCLETIYRCSDMIHYINCHLYKIFTRRLYFHRLRYLRYCYVATIIVLIPVKLCDKVWRQTSIEVGLVAWIALEI